MKLQPNFIRRASGSVVAFRVICANQAPDHATIAHATEFLSCDRDQALLLSPDLRDWLDQDHLAWFVIEAVEELNLEPFYGICLSRSSCVDQVVMERNRTRGPDPLRLGRGPGHATPLLGIRAI
jgi:hypothetical protein